MELLLLLSFEFLFDSCLKSLFVMRLSSNETSSRGFQLVSNRLREILVVTSLLIGFQTQSIQRVSKLPNLVFSQSNFG
jgi:hypothetical protein